MKKTILVILSALLAPFQALVAQTAGQDIDITHYEIHINELDFDNQTLRAEALINFMATKEVQEIVLELKMLNVRKITSIGCTIDNYEQSGDFLTINLASPMESGSSATLNIPYDGKTFSESWGGVEWWGNGYVYNLGVGFDSQPHNLGKTWFPCVDNFTDKASYDLFVRTTNDKKAICGGNHIETIDNGDGTSTWHWSTTQDIATYHISFAVGDYELWEDMYHGIERDIPIEVWVKPSQMSQVPGTFIHIKEIAAFFEENLGPYPFNRIGYVSTGKGCMEHTDNIALAASLINGTTSGEEYVAHELSHMWSGNLVTCAQAGDMWINEGFAQFWGSFYEAGIYGEEHFRNTISDKVNLINTWCNNPNNWIPLNNIPLDMTYDNKAVYERGAVIVNTMMNYMERENFLSAMRQYFEQYAYQATTSAKLRDALTQYSGIDMNGFFDTYVFSSGMPHLYASIASVTPADNQFEVLLDLRYQHIGDTHIGQDNRYGITFIGPDFELVHKQVAWDGVHGTATVLLDFEPIGMVNDFDNYWLDGKTQKNLMLRSTSMQNFANVRIEPETITDSVFVSIENHMVGPYGNPLIPSLNLSTRHFWTINRFDFGHAKLKGMFDYSLTSDGDIFQSDNDSATLLYRRNASEKWHEIAFSMYPGSTWKHGRIVIDELRSGDYALAAWDKTSFDVDENHSPTKQMLLFPNPSDNQVNVLWTTVSDGAIRIISPDGKTLRTIEYSHSNQLAIATGDLPKGCYTILLTNKDGKVLASEKLIVK